MVVRDARSDEVDRVAALILESFAEFEHDMPRVVWDTARREWADVGSRLDEAELVVAVVDGRVVGTVTFYPDASRSRTEPWPAGWSGIRIFAVHPSARRRGVGRALTEECLRRARAARASRVALKTGTFMVAARAAYEQAGFVRAPEHDHGWTGDGVVALSAGETVDALAYVLDL